MYPIVVLTTHNKIMDLNNIYKNEGEEKVKVNSKNIYESKY